MFLPLALSPLFLSRACKSTLRKTIATTIMQLICTSLDASFRQPRSQDIFFRVPEFAREIFQLISILRFLVVRRALFRRKELPANQIFLLNMDLDLTWTNGFCISKQNTRWDSCEFCGLTSSVQRALRIRENCELMFRIFRTCVREKQLHTLSFV